ncbi:MAG: hypothetical protein J2P17_34725, partial [Mycobacterium sp.]|nr:hypothetical protein [Mycobacterium sp.]
PHTHAPHAVSVAPSATAPKATKPATATRRTRTIHTARPSVKHHSANPAPSLVGLCHAWLDRPHNAGKADDSPAFTYLIHTAGGKSSVTSWCTKLLASKDDQAPGNKPSTPPGQAKSHHPTGGPTSHPTGRPHSNGNSGSHHNGH